MTTGGTAEQYPCYGNSLLRSNIKKLGQLPKVIERGIWQYIIVIFGCYRIKMLPRSLHYTQNAQPPRIKGGKATF